MHEFIAKVAKHIDHVKKVGEHCSTEETTKQALILPLLEILGFSPYDPTKVRRHIVVSGSDAAHAARTIDLLSTVGELYATENATDMGNYIAIIAKAAGNPVMPAA